MQSLKGKRAIITGAGKGLGKAIALAFATEGVNIGLISRTEADLENVSQEASKLNSDIKTASAVANVGSYNELKTAIAELTEQLGGVDILINSAGILKMGAINDLAINDWEEVIQTNVLGTYYAIHEVLPLMVAQQGGDIINIASTAGQKGNAKMSAYGASKAAVINLSEAVMQEARKSNIRVSTVNPSTIATDMTINAKFTDGNEEKVLQPSDLAQIIVAHLQLPQRAFIKEVGLWSTNP
ncbi:MAG: 3-ketoacyl-ACP reductase [Pedobacter sp.]|nr:MAG: 3-ketoacyl-ACP reductase [Pedobacter sp.]